MNMKPDRIKKGLQCCTSSEYDCNDCPLIEKKQVEGGCGHFLMKNASDYINQLEAKVETAKSDAIKEFAERLKSKLDISGCGYSTEEIASDVEDTIDNIVKEMVGDTE